MARVMKSQLTDGEIADTPRGLVEMSRAEFAQRLYNILLEKGWTQSELARRAELPRDNVSMYVRAKSSPTPQSLKKMADALGMSPSELYPTYAVASVATDDLPSFDMKMSASDPSKAYIRVNRLVRAGTAAKIAALLADEDA